MRLSFAGSTADIAEAARRLAAWLPSVRTRLACGATASDPPSAGG
jgi:hypothetical protein